MLAGIAVGETAFLLPELIRKRYFFNVRGLFIAVTITAFVLVLITLLPQTYLNFTSHASFLERERMFLVRMRNHAPKTRWVVTDTPMYAFRIGSSIPPPLAVISEKRLVTGNITEDQIITFIDKEKPEQVMIGRFRFTKLKTSLQDDYRPLYIRGRRYLYLRKDLKGK
jgi:hypothetical protein